MTGLPVYGPKPNYQYAHGVPTPYHVHRHPWPTRYHGGIWTRPVHTYPYSQHVQSVFKPDDFTNGNPRGDAYSRYPWPDRTKPYKPLGQAAVALPSLTMSPERVAQLNQCMQGCEAKYGVTGASTDPFALATCFSVCNTTYPPDVALPAALPPVTTTPTVPGLPGAAVVPPPSVVTPVPTKPKISTATMLVGGGVAAAAALGAYYYFKKRKG